MTLKEAITFIIYDAVAEGFHGDDGTGLPELAMDLINGEIPIPETEKELDELKFQYYKRHSE